MTRRLPWLALIAGVLASCDPARTEEGGGSAAPAPAAPEHPWDWVPDDPSLASGRTTYLAECALCHNEGEESAPRLAHREEWIERSNQGEDVLIRHAIEGYLGEDGEMPARGGTPDLPDDEVANAVRYMVAAATSTHP